MEKAYVMWRAFQDRLLAPAAALLLIGCTLVALAEVVRRYAFGFSFEWQQDFVTFVILSGVSLYYSVAQRHSSHLSVTILTDSLDTVGPRAHRVAEVMRLVALAFSFLFMLFVMWWGLPEVVDSLKYESRTESLAFPMWPFLVALLAGFGFMAVTMFFQIYRQVHKLLGRAVLYEPDEGAADPGH